MQARLRVRRGFRAEALDGFRRMVGLGGLGAAPTSPIAPRQIGSYAFKTTLADA
jgi:hypothetical protein